MYSLLQHPSFTTHLDRKERFGLEKDRFFLHPPARKDQKNRCAFHAVDARESTLFRSRIWLPQGSPTVRFGIRVTECSSGKVVACEIVDLPGGKEQYWLVSLGEMPERADIELWTEISPSSENNHKAWAIFYEPVLISSAERLAEDNEVLKLRDSLNAHYVKRDPWNYESTPDDQNRRIRVLSALPIHRYKRTLEIGCGDGFLTFSLPGEEVFGVDLSDKAVDLAMKARQERSDGDRFKFEALGLFDLTPERIGRFDLVVITGVLYPQYIGNSWSLMGPLIDRLLLQGGILASCHIHEWTRHYFPFARVHQSWYGYRNYTHCLEVFCK